MRIHEIALIVTAGRRNVVVILAAVTLNVAATVYLNKEKDPCDALCISAAPSCANLTRGMVATRDEHFVIGDLRFVH